MSGAEDALVDEFVDVLCPEQRVVF